MSRWPLVPFSEALVDASAGNKKTPQSQYLRRGRLAVIDQGQSRIAGYTEDESAAFTGNLPVIVFGDHTRTVKYVDFPFSMGADGVKVLRAKEGWSPRYLFHYLRHIQLPPSGYSRHFKFLRQHSVPMPPLSEQLRIAGILDLAEAQEERRQRSANLVTELISSVFFEMFGDPVTNPRKWTVRSLIELCDQYSGGTPSKAAPNNWSGRVPWFTAKDMKQADLFDSVDHVNELVTQQTRLRLLPPDTVTVVVRGMILAHTFPVCVLKTSATINQDLKALLPREPIGAQFLATCLRVQQRHILSRVSTAAHGTKKLDTRGLRGIPVLLPPKDMRDEFERRVRRINSHQADELRSAQLQAELTASVRAHAFGGTP